MAIGLLTGIGAGIAKSLAGGGAKKASGKQIATKMLATSKPKESALTKAKPKTQLVPVGGGGGKAASERAVKEIKPEKTNQNVVPGLKPILESLRKSLASIKKTLSSMISFDKKDAKEKNKRRLKILRNIAGVPLSIVGGAIGIAKNAVQKTGFLDMIQNYFMKILIGGLVLFLVRNAEAIIEKIKEVFDKVKEVFDKINEVIIQPLWNLAKAMVGGIYDTIKKILEFPPIQDAVDAVKKALEDLEKKFPAIAKALNFIQTQAGQAVTSAQDLLGFDGGGGGGGSSQYDTSSGGLVASGGIAMTSEAKSQASKAGFGESEFTLFRDVVAKIESGGEYDIQGGSGGAYSGRYQMGADARKDAARFLGETYQGDSEAARQAFRKDPEMQERYFAAYTRGNHETLMNLSPQYRELSKEGKLQVLGYAHNAGAGNAVDWLKSNRSESFRDGFNTRSDKYSDSIRKAQEQRRQPAPPSQQPSSGRSRAPVGESRVSQDIKDYRQFRNKQFGASAERTPTGTAQLYQVRELGVYGSGNYNISPLADDTSYEINLHKGAGHHENRAFDIPVPNSSAEGDAVAEFWRSRGYKVIWRSAGHYDHVHVEVPKAKAPEFFKIMSSSPKPPSEQAQQVSRNASYEGDKYGRTQLVAVAVPTPSGGGASGGGRRSSPTSGGTSRAEGARQQRSSMMTSAVYKNA